MVFFCDPPGANDLFQCGLQARTLVRFYSSCGLSNEDGVRAWNVLVKLFAALETRCLEYQNGSIDIFIAQQVYDSTHKCFAIMQHLPDPRDAFGASSDTDQSYKKSFHSRESTLLLLEEIAEEVMSSLLPTLELLDDEFHEGLEGTSDAPYLAPLDVNAPVRIPSQRPKTSDMPTLQRLSDDYFEGPRFPGCKAPLYHAWQDGYTSDFVVLFEAGCSPGWREQSHIHGIERHAAVVYYCQAYGGIPDLSKFDIESILGGSLGDVIGDAIRHVRSESLNHVMDLLKQEFPHRFEESPVGISQAIELS